MGTPAKLKAGVGAGIHGERKGARVKLERQGGIKHEGSGKVMLKISGLAEHVPTYFRSGPQLTLGGMGEAIMK